MFRSYSHHMVADLCKRRRSAFAAPTPLFVRAHGRCPQNRRTCANQPAELCVPKRIQPGQTCARQGRLTTHRRRLSPYADTGVEECYSGTSNHDNRVSGGTEAPLQAAEAATEELNP